MSVLAAFDFTVIISTVVGSLLATAARIAIRELRASARRRAELEYSARERAKQPDVGAYRGGVRPTSIPSAGRPVRG